MILGKKRKKISYYITTTPLVSCNATQIKDLSIQYKEKPIQNLYTSTITIQNIGNCIIETSDFALSNPLSLITDEEFLINKDPHTPTFTKNDSNHVSLHMEMTNGTCKKSLIQFDYIAKKECIYCNVFHTGKIHVSGHLKDGKIINTTGVAERFNEMLPDMLLTMLFLSIILLFLSFYEQYFG